MASSSATAAGRIGGGGVVGLQGSAAATGITSDRHVNRDSRTSPLHEPPSYTQAMTSTVVASKMDSGPRKRSMSASVAGSLPIYSTRPLPTSGDNVALISLPLAAATVSAGSGDAGTMGKNKGDSKLQQQPQPNEQQHPLEKQHHPLEKRQQQERKRESQQQQQSPLENAVESLTDNRPSNNHGQLEQASKRDTGCKQPTSDNSGSVIGTEAKSEQGKIAQEEAAESEFARNVRGTSTPVDLSLTHSPNQSRTFDVRDTTDVVPTAKVEMLDTVEFVVSSSEEQGKRNSLGRNTLQREKALDPEDEA